MANDDNNNNNRKDSDNDAKLVELAAPPVGLVCKCILVRVQKSH